MEHRQTISRRDFLKLCLAAVLCGTLPALVRWGEPDADDIAFLKKAGVVDCARSDIKTACLTYDDQIAPHQIERINRLLDDLRAANARASFFFTGEDCAGNRSFEPYARLIERILTEGHTWGCHGWKHQPYTSVKTQTLRAEVEMWLAAAEKVAPGYPVRYFRPPYGDVNQHMIDLLAEYGLQVVLWNVESGGLDEHTLEYVQKGVRRVEKAKKCPLILSHMSRYYDIEQAAAIAAWLSGQGYALANLDDGIPRTMVRPSLRKDSLPEPWIPVPHKRRPRLL